MSLVDVVVASSLSLSSEEDIHLEVVIVVAGYTRSLGLCLVMSEPEQASCRLVACLARRVVLREETTGILREMEDSSNMMNCVADDSIVYLALILLSLPSTNLLFPKRNERKTFCAEFIVHFCVAAFGDRQTFEL